MKNHEFLGLLVCQYNSQLESITQLVLLGFPVMKGTTPWSLEINNWALLARSGFSPETCFMGAVLGGVNRN